MSFLGQENILWFQVPVDYVSAVQILNSQENLSGIELGHLFFEDSPGPKQVEELSLF